MALFCDCKYVFCFIIVVEYCWLIFRKHGKVNQSIKLVPCSVFRKLLILLFSGCLNGKRIQNKTQTVRSFSGVMANCLKPTQMIRRENEYIMLETRENARNRSQKMCIRRREPIMHHTQRTRKECQQQYKYQRIIWQRKGQLMDID